MGAGEGEIDGEGEDEIGHGVFAHEPETDAQTGKQPPAPGAIVERAHEAVKRQRPEQQERRVGRDDGGRERHRRQGPKEERREEPDALVEQPPADAADRERGQKMDRRHRQLDAGDAVAANRRRRHDDPGHHRRLGEIAEGEVLGPNPVLGFIGIEIEGKDEKIEEAERRYRPKHPGHGPKPVNSAALPGHSGPFHHGGSFHHGGVIQRNRRRRTFPRRRSTIGPDGIVRPGAVERVRGIEPLYSAWEADVLPLNYTRAEAASEIYNRGRVRVQGRPAPSAACSRPSSGLLTVYPHASSTDHLLPAQGLRFQDGSPPLGSVRPWQARRVLKQASKRQEVQIRGIT